MERPLHHALPLWGLILVLGGCLHTDPPPGEPLSSADTEQLLAELPPLDDAGDAPDDNSTPGPEAPEPPVVDSKDTTPAFAEPEAPSPPDSTRAPTVVRHTPRGDVDRAELISLGFSEPMVPVGRHREEVRPPVTLSPAVEGHWRWVDTRHLVFEPDAETLPMATDFRVSVAEDFTSAAGVPLGEPLEWTFSTPPLRITGFHPGAETPVSRQPVLVLVFNQPVDTDRLLDALALTDSETRYKLKPADRTDIEEDTGGAGAFIDALETAHWRAVVPTRALPRDRAFTLTLDKDTPAATGHRLTESTARRPFRTAGPLRIDEIQCGHRSPCDPERGLSVRLSHALSEDWEPSRLNVSPDVPDLDVNHYDDRLYLTGSFAPNTDYTLTLEAGTRDRFGQVLPEALHTPFQTGDYTPQLKLPGWNLVTLPAGDDPRLPIMTRNLNTLTVTLRSVSPEQWPAFNKLHNESHRQGVDQVNWPGDIVDTFQLSPDNDDHQLATTHLALKRALNREGTGHLIVTIDARDDPTTDGPQASNQSLQQALWVQVTHLSASTYTTAQGLTAWVTRLDNGEPIPDASVRLGDDTVLTDQNGTATLADPTGREDTPAQVTLGDDSLLLPDRPYHPHWFRQNPLRYPALTFTDRGLYRPGESVRLKGIIRHRAVTPEGDLSLPVDINQVAWTAYDGNREEVGTGNASLNAMGAFEVALRLPESTASGGGHFELTVDSGREKDPENTFHQPFQIQEFRRPEYEVHTSLNQTEPVSGQPVNTTVEAGYYAGGPLPNAEVRWDISLRESHYAPPGWEAYVFGRWQPFWRRGLWPTPEPEQWQRSFEGTTDASGRHRLTLEPDDPLTPEERRYPHRLTADSTVTDVNRQQWSDRADTLIHPADRYVGLRTNRLFAHQGDTVTLEWVLVDIDGEERTTEQPVIQVERLSRSNGEHTVEQTLPCEPDDAESGQCRFTPERAGEYRLTATVTDSEGRENRTQMTLWVTGADAPRPFDDTKEDLEVQLIPDREEYRPGDTADIRIQTPFDTAEAFITLQRMGLKAFRSVHMKDGQYTLSVPITETSLPSLTVGVEAVATEKPASRQVAPHASGEITLPVSTRSRTLAVDVAPADKALKPGEASQVTVEVSDHTGQPFKQGEVTLYAVDESVLSMAGYDAPDAMTAFYGDMPPLVHTQRSRDNVFARVIDESVQETALGAGRQSVADGAALERAAPDAKQDGGTALRTHFNPLATFQSTVPLDQDGRADVSFTLPDTLTRYRLIAVAYGEKQFGTGESDLTVGLPLMVRPSLPRFLNLGDKVELPVVVHNTTDEPMTVELALRAGNLTLTDAPGRRLTLPANDRRELRFTARPQQVGEARVQVIARSEEHRDAAETTLPVQRPATREAFARYGSLTGGNAFLAVAVPEAVYPDFGGLNLTTSSTQFPSLTDAFLYLLEYPYGGSEQIASRLMAIASLEDLLEAFDADGLPEKEAIHKSVDDILARLSERQNSDGGWSFWTRDGDSQGYLSVHVTHSLVRARNAGYAVPNALLKRALSYTDTVGTSLPEAMNARAANSVKAYALYVLALADQPDPKAAMTLFEHAGDDLSLEAMGWLLSVVADEDRAQAMRDDIHRRLNNQLRDTAATASFAEDYSDDGHRVLHGRRRTDAVVLEALLTTRPESDLIEKLARGLLNDRRNGHWGNTQENVFALLALKSYFLARESEVPDLTARAWLGDQFLGEHRYEGRTTESHREHQPMSALKTGDRTPTLALQHRGTGRLYYRLGMEYAPKDLQRDAASHGFRVKRHYEAVNDPNDVTQAKDGRWEIKAGAAVRVTLTLTVPARRHHVALSDRLPAGFEALNPALETSARPVPEPRLRSEPASWPVPHWYQHHQLRDDRAEAFSTDLEAGVYHYEYTALATTPGEFVIPPARAEEMYRPETFGRSATERVRIVESP